MEKSFALITEGVSEHQIVKHILQRYLQEEPNIVQIQPEIVDGKQKSIGGWNEVLKYCEREENLRTILQFNDYIVIQIDTDQCETAPYSVSRREKGKQLSMEQLWQKVYERIMNALPLSIDKTRIIIAISSETIECWLLPVCCTREGDKQHTNQCLLHLNNELRRLGIHPIIDKNSDQSRHSYQVVLSKMRKPKEIKQVAAYHYGFEQFLLQLDNVNELSSI